MKNTDNHQLRFKHRMELKTLPVNILIHLKKCNDQFVQVGLLQELADIDKQLDTTSPDIRLLGQRVKDNNNVIAAIKVPEHLRHLIDENGEPWFPAKDIAEILEYSGTNKMTSRLDEDEKSTRRSGVLAENAGGRGVTLINESGLYSVILSSQKPEAKKFKRWVTHDVLPSIRKNGYYQSKKGSTKLISAEKLKQFRLISDKLAHEYLLDCGVDPDWIKEELPKEKVQQKIVRDFWAAYRTIGYLSDSADNPLNHSAHPEIEIAINLEHFFSLCA